MHENVKVRHGQVGGYLEGSKHAESGKLSKSCQRRKLERVIFLTLRNTNSWGLARLVQTTLASDIRDRHGFTST